MSRSSGCRRSLRPSPSLTPARSAIAVRRLLSSQPEKIANVATIANRCIWISLTVVEKAAPYPVSPSITVFRAEAVAAPLRRRMTQLPVMMSAQSQSHFLMPLYHPVFASSSVLNCHFVNETEGPLAFQAAGQTLCVLFLHPMTTRNADQAPTIFI